MNAVLLSECVTWIKDLFKHECEDKGFFPVIILLVFIVGNVSLIMDISTGLAQGLSQAGVRELDTGLTGDELDAVTCALVGISYLRGKYRAIGDPDEMLMILPQ